MLFIFIQLYYATHDIFLIVPHNFTTKFELTSHQDKSLTNRFYSNIILVPLLPYVKTF